MGWTATGGSPARWVRAGLVLAVTAALTTACSDGDLPAAVGSSSPDPAATAPSGDPTPSPASARPTASPTPTTTAPPATTLTLGFDRLGPAHLGMTMDEFGAALGMPVTPTASSGVTDPCWFERLGGVDSGLAVMSVEGRDGPVVRIDVVSDRARDVLSLPRTELGLGVGSTVDEVRAAYAGHVEESPHAYVDGLYLTVTGPDAPPGTALVFETDGSGVVTSMRSGLSEPVAYVEGCA